MRQPPVSIADHIDCLARITGAPVSFVDQVRALFRAKGISLDQNATPFIEALEEAFRREECIRSSTYRARQNLAKLQENFQKIGRAYVQQLANVKVRSDAPAPKLRRRASAGREPRTTQITIHGDHRTFVTRPEREDLPLVPGPEELQ